MQSAYILHGCCDEEEYFSNEYPSPSNFHWIPWLQKQLVMKGFNCQTPELTNSYKPDYALWSKLFGIYPVDDETILVGHSCGAGFFLRYLSERKDIRIKKLILVAPWMDPKHSRADFLQFVLDPALLERIGELHIFYSEDEPVGGVKETVDTVTATYPAAIMHRFANHGHFCLSDMGTDAFPELLDVVTK